MTLIVARRDENIDQLFWSQVIAALYANTTLVIELLETIHFPNSKEPITDQFVTQWVKDADQFPGWALFRIIIAACTSQFHSVHDKKMSVLGFCALLQSGRRPRAVLNNAHHFVPAIIVQMKALVQCYQGNHLIGCVYDRTVMKINNLWPLTKCSKAYFY